MVQHTSLVAIALLLHTNHCCYDNGCKIQPVQNAPVVRGGHDYTMRTRKKSILANIYFVTLINCYLIENYTIHSPIVKRCLAENPQFKHLKLD